MKKTNLNNALIIVILLMLITIAIVPIIIVYIALSKYIVAGVALGGVKE